MMNQQKATIFATLFLAIFIPNISANNILKLIEPTIKQTGETITKCRLNEAELKSILDWTSTTSTANEMQKYVLVKLLNNGNDPKEEYFLNECHFLLNSNGYKICTIDTLLPSSALISNITIVMNPGHSFPYYGRHDPSILARFVAQLEQRFKQSLPYQTIETKMDKKSYERVFEAKILAYYPDTTAPGFSEFQKAAKLKSVNLPFFVVHNPQLAAKYRLTEPGQISLVRWLEKSQLFFTPSTLSTPITAEDILKWIQTNRGLTLHELKDTNLYDPEIQDVNKYQLVAIGDKQSSLGLYFFKLISRTIQNITRENEMILNPSLRFNEHEEMQVKDEMDNLNLNDLNLTTKTFVPLDDIEIVWIDLNEFPNTVINLENQYQIDSTNNIWFGLIHDPINIGNKKWFNMDQLNFTQSDRTSDQHNIEQIYNWIMTVTNRISTPSYITDLNLNLYLLEPEPVSVRQHGSFVLECKAREGMNCGWMKNSSPVNNIGVTGSRYQYVNKDNQPNDCSLMVNKVDTSQDQGEWTCFVNNDQNTNYSKRTVMVTVRNSGQSLKNEL